MHKEKLNIAKKACHVTSAHSRYDVRIFHKECKSLARYGFDVVLLVNDMEKDELIDDVRIISTHFYPKNRYERMVASQRYIKEKAIAIDADIYHFHDPELLPLASRLKSMGKKVIFDLHEDVSQQILYKTWIPRALRKGVSGLYKVYESKKIMEFDALITVTPKFVERLMKINPNTVMITNYPILSYNELACKDIENNSICFAGGISSQWGHINIIKAIDRIDGITYLLAGAGSREYLNILESLEGWDKVDYFGRISHEEVKGIYSKSLAGMTLLSNKTQVGDEGTLGNTKIFEFMEAGLPIICSNNKLWKELVEKYECGIAVNPNKVDEIEKAIKYLCANPERASKMGNNGRIAVENEYNWKTQETELIKLYNSL